MRRCRWASTTLTSHLSSRSRFNGYDTHLVAAGPVARTRRDRARGGLSALAALVESVGGGRREEEHHRLRRVLPDAASRRALDWRRPPALERGLEARRGSARHVCRAAAVYYGLGIGRRDAPARACRGREVAGH